MFFLDACKFMDIWKGIKAAFATGVLLTCMILPVTFFANQISCGVPGTPFFGASYAKETSSPDDT
jgi:hypothetical protein